MALSARIVKQYEQGVLFRLGRVQGPRNPGFRLIIPFIDVQQRNLQSLVEIGVDKNTTVVFPGPPPPAAAGPIPPPLPPAEPL